MIQNSMDISTSEVWQALYALLPETREQRLAYLLYHCGLMPREIVQLCPQEWGDIQEIYRLRHRIMECILPHADRLHLSGNSSLEVGLK